MSTIIHRTVTPDTYISDSRVDLIREASKQLRRLCLPLETLLAQIVVLGQELRQRAQSAALSEDALPKQAAHARYTVQAVHVSV